MSQASDLIRKLFKEGDDVRDAGLKTPEDIERFDDIVYGDTDPVYQSLDVYRPRKLKGDLPVIVSVHGGGWVYGDKERYQYYCMELAQAGYAVVNFSYRLAPEYQFPAPFEDTNMVFQWVMDHAGEYGFDLDNLFAVGDSAGANILSVYAALCTNKEFQKDYDLIIPEGLRFKAIGLFCGSYVISFMEQEEESPIPTRELMMDFLPEQGSKKEIDAISAARHITKDYPPTYFMTSNGDFLKDDAPVLQKALFENNVPFEFQFFGGEKVLNHVFHLNIRTLEAKKANASVLFYFKNFQSE